MSVVNGCATVTMTTSNATASPQTFPLGSDLIVATINVNGAHADQQDGSRIVTRVKVVLSHMKELQVQVFAMQELYTYTPTNGLRTTRVLLLQSQGQWSPPPPPTQTSLNKWMNL